MPGMGPLNAEIAEVSRRTRRKNRALLYYWRAHPLDALRSPQGLGQQLLARVLADTVAAIINDL